MTSYIIFDAGCEPLTVSSWDEVVDYACDSYFFNDPFVVETVIDGVSHGFQTIDPSSSCRH